MSELELFETKASLLRLAKIALRLGMDETAWIFRGETVRLGQALYRRRGGAKHPTAPGWWGRRDTRPVQVFWNREVIRGDEYLCYSSGFSFPIPCHACNLRGRWVGPYETSDEAKEAANDQS